MKIESMLDRRNRAAAYMSRSLQRRMFSAAKGNSQVLDSLSALLLRQASLDGDAAAGLLLDTLLGYMLEFAAPCERDAGTLASLLQMHSTGPDADYMSPLDCLFHAIETGEEWDLIEHRWKPGKNEPMPDAPFVRAYAAFRDMPSAERDRAARRLTIATARIEEYPGWEPLSAAIIVNAGHFGSETQ